MKDCAFCNGNYDLEDFVSCSDCGADGCYDCIETYRRCCNGEGLPETLGTFG